MLQTASFVQMNGVELHAIAIFATNGRNMIWSVWVNSCVLKALNNNKFCSIDDKDCTKNRNDPGVEFRLSSAITGPGPSGSVPDCGPGTVMADKGPMSGKCVADCGPGTVVADRGPMIGKCVADCGPGTVMSDMSGKCVADCGPGTVLADKGPEWKVCSGLRTWYCSGR